MVAGWPSLPPARMGGRCCGCARSIPLPPKRRNLKFITCKLLLDLVLGIGAPLFLHSYTTNVLLLSGEEYGLASLDPCRHLRQHQALDLTFRGKLDFIPSVYVQLDFQLGTPFTAVNSFEKTGVNVEVSCALLAFPF